MAARREELTLTYLKLETMFPPVERFSGTVLPELNLALCKHHDFEGYHISGDTGAHFYTEGIRDIELERGTLSVTEHVRKDIEMLRREFCDILEIIQNHLSIPAFFGPAFVLRALWPVGHDVGATIQRVLQIHDDQLGLLKMDIDGAGFMVFGTEREGDDVSHYTIRVQPYLSDSSQLFIELDRHGHQVIETPAVIEQWIQHSYEVLMENTAALIESLRLTGEESNGQ